MVHSDEVVYRRLPAGIPIDESFRRPRQSGKGSQSIPRAAVEVTGRRDHTFTPRRQIASEVKQSQRLSPLLGLAGHLHKMADDESTGVSVSGYGQRDAEVVLRVSEVQVADGVIWFVSIESWSYVGL